MSSGDFMLHGYSGTSSPQHAANNSALARSYMAFNNMSIEQLMAMEAPDDEWMTYPDYRELLHRQRVELETLRKRQFEEREWYKERKRLEMLATPRTGTPASQVHWSVHSTTGRLCSHLRAHAQLALFLRRTVFVRALPLSDHYHPMPHVGAPPMYTVLPVMSHVPPLHPMLPSVSHAPPLPQLHNQRQCCVSCVVFFSLSSKHFF